MSILNESQTALYAARYTAGIVELEQHIADCRSKIATMEGTIAELKQRAPYVGGSANTEIAGYYGLIDSYNQAITNSQSKIADYRAAIAQVEQDAAATNAAISKTQGRLSGLDTSVDF